MGRRVVVSFRPSKPTPHGCVSAAARMAIPQLPEELFLESLRQLIAVDRGMGTPAGGEESLYVRPLVFATEAGLGVRPAKAYRYLVIASPAGAYFPRASSR